MLVRIAYDQIYPGQGRDFFGGALGITACNYDACFGILAADSTDCGTGILIGACRDRTGVQNYDRCPLRTRGAGQALFFELAFQGGAVGLRGAASEVFYKESGHTLW